MSSAYQPTLWAKVMAVMAVTGVLVFIAVMAVVAFGCQAHFFGRYYQGKELETVWETPDEVVGQQEDPHRRIGPWGDADLSDVVP